MSQIRRFRIAWHVQSRTTEARVVRRADVHAPGAGAGGVHCAAEGRADARARRAAEHRVRDVAVVPPQPRVRVRDGAGRAQVCGDAVCVRRGADAAEPERVVLFDEHGMRVCDDDGVRGDVRQQGAVREVARARAACGAWHLVDGDRELPPADCVLAEANVHFVFIKHLNIGNECKLHVIVADI